jgi:hypothetical protein
MPAKKEPKPLHVSRALIQREQANVVLRTQRRIALLRANANSQDNDNDTNDNDKPVRLPDNWHCCLNTICFCMLLVLLNLLFLQWLYYKSLNLNLKQL